MSKPVKMPNEVLLQIMESFAPDLIDTFSVCCKRFYALSATNFPEHKKMKALYSTVCCGTKDVGSYYDNLITLLHALLDNPDITKYVKTLRMRHCHCAGMMAASKDSLRREVQLIAQWLPNALADEREIWVRRMFFGSQLQVAVLIASMLPHLETFIYKDDYFLGLQSDDIPPEWEYRVLQEFVALATRPAQTAESKVFNKLSRVELFWNRADDHVANPKLIHLFAGLPSISHIRATNMVDSGDQWTASHPDSSLGKIVFDHCVIRSDCLRRIIGSIAALQEFSSHCYLDNREYDVELKPRYHHIEEAEPKDIVQNLFESAGHSLVNLDLSDAWHTNTEDLKRGHFMGSLHGFQVLKRLRVDYRMFVDRDDGRSTLTSRTHRMIDILPVSVEAVTLTGPMMDRKCMIKLLHGLGKRKEVLSSKPSVEAKETSRLGQIFYESCRTKHQLRPIRALFSKVKGIKFIQQQWADKLL